MIRGKKKKKKVNGAAMSDRNAQNTPYKRRSWKERQLASLTDAGGSGGRLDKDTLSPDDRAAANPYSSPVSGERSRARSSCPGIS